MPPMDRNERARQESQHALARGAFQRAWDEGRARLVDRFGNPIAVDQYVLFHPRQDLIFKVLSVGPSPDPRVTAGVVQVVLETTVPLLYSIQEQAQDMCVVGRQTAPGHNELTGPTMPAKTAVAGDGSEQSSAAATPPAGEADGVREGDGGDGGGQTNG
jgi:hypothetical protein